MENTEVLAELRNRLTELNGSFTEEYERQRKALMFESGVQWSPEQEKARGNRPTMVCNMTRGYVDRIVNPYLLNPVSVKVGGTKDIISNVVKVFVDKVESDSCANEAYQTGFRTAVTCGRGYIHVGATYANNYSMNQNLSVDTIRDPLSCYLDPSSEAIDGSDAIYGVYIKYISKTLATNKYGAETVDCSLGVYDNWKVPDDSVASVLYYTKRFKSIRRQFLGDGRFVDAEEDYEGAIRSRNIDEVSVDCIHVIGEKVISTTNYKMPCIPIIPIYGNRAYFESGIQYTGIVDQVEDTQRMINYYNSSEAELTGLAPKSPFLITAGQIGPNKEMWRNANTVSYDALVWTPEVVDGVMTPAPTRLNNTANTQHLSASKQQAISDLGRETGVFDNMFGQYNQSSESGVAINSRTMQGEIGTAQYQDNLEKSIKQVGKVMIYLMLNVYDTPRTIELDGEEVQITFSELPIDPETMGLDIYTGPSIESKKQEAINTLNEMMRLNPAAVPLLSIRVAENLNTPNKDKIVADLKRLVPAELRDPEDAENKEGEMDPKAMAALQAAQQTIASMDQLIEQYEAAIGNMQTQLISDQASRASDIEMERLKAVVNLSKTSSDNKTKVVLKAMELRVNPTRELADIEADEQAAIDLINAAAEREMLDVGQDIRGIIEEAPMDPMGHVQNTVGPNDLIEQVTPESFEQGGPMDELSGLYPEV